MISLFSFGIREPYAIMMEILMVFILSIVALLFLLITANNSDYCGTNLILFKDILSPNFLASTF
ncbi:hypothetical protein C6C12_01375 [Clostridium botulinum]|nr:hypothetical protein C6C12_01375 [Clostridium botulinum]